MASPEQVPVSKSHTREGAPARYRKEEKYNPLVRIALAIGGLLVVSLSRDLVQFGYVSVLFLLLCFVLGFRLRSLGRNIRMILPWTGIFFAIHLGFSILVEPGTAFWEVLRRESIVLFRFIGLAGVMGILRDGLNAQAVVDSLKTLMDRLHLRSRLGEDLLQTLRLILLFIPQVMREFRSLERFNLALGFDSPSSLKGRVQFYGGNLLPVMSRSVSRARQLGEVMNLRGYGQVVPRGQLTPRPLVVRDIAALLVIALLLGSMGWVF